MMTLRERVEAALRHCNPDRTPIFEHVLLSPLANQFLGRPYGGDPANWPALVHELGWEQAVRREAADRLDLAVLLGHDMFYVVPNPPPLGTEAAPSPATSGPPDDPVECLRQRNEAEKQRPAKPHDDSLFICSVLV